MSASLSCTWGPLLPVKAMESMPDVFTEEANRILSKGFCDEVKETGNKLLIPKNYMDEYFNTVMYKLVGVETDYFDSVPYDMWKEMVAETTEEIMNRCRNILPYGSIIGNWKYTQDHGNGAILSATNLFRTDGKTVRQGIMTVTNPEDGMVASISFKIDGEYVIAHEIDYYSGVTIRNGELRDISREPSDFSKSFLSQLEDSLNGNMIDQLNP